MGKRRHSEDTEIPFVALMDTMTNVVGVLIIVLVMVGLGVSTAVKKILSDLPPVDESTYQQLKTAMEKEGAPPDPDLLDQNATETEKQLAKLADELKSLDTTSVKTEVANIENVTKQLDEKKKERDARKLEIEKLLAEAEAMKLRLDQTPIYKAEPGTVVKLPNPRPYPEQPKETRIIVAKAGIIIFSESEYLAPVIDGLDKVRSQMRYDNPKIDPFAAMLEEVLGSKEAVQKAWPEIAPFAGVYQMDAVAQAYQALVAGNIQPTKRLLQAIGNLSIRLGNLGTRMPKPLPDMAAAIAAATQGDPSKWVTWAPPLKVPTDQPLIKAAKDDNKVTFTWRAKTEEVRANPRNVLDYFEKLADLDEFKDASDNRMIYDAFKVRDTLARAAASPAISKSFEMTPVLKPGQTTAQVTLTPKGGAGESAQQMGQPTSQYVLALRNLKNDPNGVAVFQILPDAIVTYLEARRIAEEVGVPATWSFVASLEITANVPGFEVQRFTLAKPARTGPAALIAPPKRTVE